jgi:cellulose synthase/poly-beta-1,6-N-acetylglucosamine synthase-like glycosyltransferase
MIALTLIAAGLSLPYCAAVLFLARGLARTTRASHAAHNLNFSVVIAAHNEEENVSACLTSVLRQTIPASRFEVILVNDRSIDATAKRAEAIAETHANLSVINIPSTPIGLSPKKHAVGQGISAARNEIVVFTDADCTVPDTWLEIIDRYFDEHTGLVQGITVYRKTPGMNDIFFGLQAVDFLSHGVVAAAAIGAGLPLNSNANNFAFRKRAFLDAQGYGELGAVISGDDDLLLQRIWRNAAWRIRYMPDASAKVFTLPTPTPGAVFEQRKRWGSKTVYYNPRQVGLLSAVFLFYVGISAFFIAGFIRPHCFAFCAGMLLVKILGEIALMMPGTRMFGELPLRAYIVPASLLQLPMVIAAVAAGVFGRFSWKGQRFARTSR